MVKGGSCLVIGIMTLLWEKFSLFSCFENASWSNVVGLEDDDEEAGLLFFKIPSALTEFEFQPQDCS